MDSEDDGQPSAFSASAAHGGGAEIKIRLQPEGNFKRELHPRAAAGSAPTTSTLDTLAASTSDASIRELLLDGLPPIDEQLAAQVKQLLCGDTSSLSTVTQGHLDALPLPFGERNKVREGSIIEMPYYSPPSHAFWKALRPPSEPPSARPAPGQSDSKPNAALLVLTRGQNEKPKPEIGPQPAGAVREELSNGAKAWLWTAETLAHLNRQLDQLAEWHTARNGTKRGAIKAAREDLAAAWDVTTHVIKAKTTGDPRRDAMEFNRSSSAQVVRHRA